MLNPKNKNIVFIGFMGVGKGTIARSLIQKTKRMGLDTDDIIESMENRKIKDIFARRYFTLVFNSYLFL